MCARVGVCVCVCAATPPSPLAYILGEELEVDGPLVEEDPAQLKGTRQVAHRVRGQEGSSNNKLGGGRGGGRGRSSER